MSEAWMAMVVGLSVLASAAVLMIAHYRREHLRKRLLRWMDHRRCWKVMRRRHCARCLPNARSALQRSAQRCGVASPCAPMNLPELHL